MVLRRLSRLLALVLIVACVLFSGARLRGQGKSGNSGVTKSDTAPPSPGYTNKASLDQRCISCHRSEVEGYARSAMANSLRRAGKEPDGIVQTSDTKITMHSSPTGYWQSLESGADVRNYRVDYVVGSGKHAAGYLLDVDDHLFESPVAFYASRHAYDLAPGYEGRPNPDFTRSVGEGCLFCHAGTALPIAGTTNRYWSPPFSAEAITCERCHGSAEKHLQDPRAGTIVNPATLDHAARDSICEQCHLLGVGRVLNPGKTFADFRPGRPLEDVLTTYHTVLPPGSEDSKFKVISHVEQLARSTCARKSNGVLWCGTCHDPHNKPVEPVAFFRSKCLTCHTGNFTVSHPSKESNCIGCHMPRRDAKDGGHTAFTDHRIQRRPQPESDLPADTDIAAWREPAPELQKRNLGIAYINAGMERQSGPFLVRGYRLLAEVQTQFANDSDLFSSIGNALLLAKQPVEAQFAFERALQLNPNSAAGETNAASAYLQAGNIDAAVTHLQRAVALDPLHLDAIAPLIRLYKQQGHDAEAEALSAKISSLMNQRSDGTESVNASAIDPQKKVEEVFKNIQFFKGVSSEQLIPSMRFITQSLGVECSYCHVQDHFEKDDKKPKQVARQMMRMMATINQSNFDGNRQVTCYSCHRGSPKPEGTPEISQELQPKETAAKTPSAEILTAELPTTGQLIDNYIQALGGAAAIENISSRKETGAINTKGKTNALEVFTRGPDKIAVVQHMSAGDSIEAFDGNAGWLSAPNHSAREMRGTELDAARMDADLHFPLHLKADFADLRVEYPESIAGRQAYVISVAKPGQPPIKLFFDEQSGLLVRLLRYANSPLGVAVTQIDYSDYRYEGGVKIPFHWTITGPGEHSTIQINQVEENVPIDDARFVKPVSTAMTSTQSGNKAQ
jgi:photosynthetic reaction center cytochrome c subunit